MKLSDFHYELPRKLIAQEPSPDRAGSRMLVLHRESGAISHHHFTELPDLLSGDEVIVFNDTRVIPARLYARKESGGLVEILAVRFPSPTTIFAWTKSSKPLRPRQLLSLRTPGVRLVVLDVPAPGRALLETSGGVSAMALLAAEGSAPLPPYIRRPPPSPLQRGSSPQGKDQSPIEVTSRSYDLARYQTVYARHEGSIAAPTAGLHFTEKILEELRSKGCTLVFITLHIGPGTFEPVRVEEIEQHRMEQEYYSISKGAAATIRDAKARGRRIVAIGTTTVRALEAASISGTLRYGSGETNLFIYPGFKFTTVDCLLTNFHLPGSTLIMLVSAFAGRSRVFHAYQEAIKERYRFYSYGDCMLIL